MDNLELEVRKTVLDNAVKYEGKPSAKSVMSALLGSRADLRPRAGEVKKLVEKLVEEVSRMSHEDQIAELKQIAPELLETPDVVEPTEDKEPPELPNAD
jgi:glutamyl-tRNA synthetase